MNTITVLVYNEEKKPEPRELPAMPVGIFAVHRPVEEYYAKYWALSHTASGYRLGFARTRRDAKVAAETLAKLDVTWYSDPKRFSNQDRALIVETVRQLQRDGVLIPQ